MARAGNCRTRLADAALGAPSGRRVQQLRLQRPAGGGFGRRRGPDSRFRDVEPHIPTAKGYLANPAISPCRARRVSYRLLARAELQEQGPVRLELRTGSQVFLSRPEKLRRDSGT